MENNITSQTNLSNNAVDILDVEDSSNDSESSDYVNCLGTPISVGRSIANAEETEGASQGVEKDEDFPHEFNTRHLGNFVAEGNFISATLRNLILSDELESLVELRVEPRGMRKDKRFRRPAANPSSRILYIRVKDPSLEILQRSLHEKCPQRVRTTSHTTPNKIGLEKIRYGARDRDSLLDEDLSSLLSKFDDRTSSLRLMANGQQAIRFCRSASKMLISPLLLGIIEAKYFWLASDLPPKRPAVGSSIKVGVIIYLKWQAFNLSTAKMRLNGCTITYLRSGEPSVRSLKFAGLIGESMGMLFEALGLSSRVPKSINPLQPGANVEGGLAVSNLTVKTQLNVDRGQNDVKGEVVLAAEDDSNDLGGCTDRKVTRDFKLSKDCSDANGCDKVHKRKLEIMNDTLDIGISSPRFGRHKPSSVFLSPLRPYQEEGVWWMLCRESGGFPTFHHSSSPAWKQYELTGDPNMQETPLRFFFNERAGLFSLKVPQDVGGLRGGILADAMGLGKTVQLLAVIANDVASNVSPTGLALKTSSHFLVETKAKNRIFSDFEKKIYRGGTLIVLPLSLLSQWRSEIDKHIDKGVVTVCWYHGADRERDPHQIAAYTIVLTTYQTVALEFKPFLKEIENSDFDCFFKLPYNSKDAVKIRHYPLLNIYFRRIVLDEGHVIKAQGSCTSRACCALQGGIRWVLTGTPLQNHIDDAFPLFKFLNAEPMANQKWWKNNITKVVDLGNYSAALSALKSVISPIMLRRHGTEVGSDGKKLLHLPTLTKHTIYVSLTDAERILYLTLFQQSKASFEHLVNTGVALEKVTHVLILLLRLRQACNHPCLPAYRQEEDQAQGHWEKYNEENCARNIYNKGLKVHSASSCCDELLQGSSRIGGLPACSLCLQQPPVFPVIITKCSHIFCLGCLRGAVSDASLGVKCLLSCPSCQCSMTESDVRSLPSLNNLELWRDVVLRKLQSKSEGFLQRCGNETQVLNLKEDDIRVQDRSSMEGLAFASSIKDNFESHERHDLEFFLKSNAFFFSSKIRILIAFLAADIKCGRSAVVFSQWTGMLDLIEQAIAAFEKLEGTFKESDAEGRIEESDRIIQYRRIDGSMPQGDRQRAIEWFMKISHGKMEPDDESFLGIFPYSQFSIIPKNKVEMKRFSEVCKVKGRILLLSLKTGYLGLNLTAACRCYLMDSWWNPQTENQAMKRIWRFGQDKPVSIFCFVCLETVEERIEELKKWKGWMSDKVLGSHCDEGFSEPPTVDSVSENELNKNRLSLADLKMLFKDWEDGSARTEYNLNCGSNSPLQCLSTHQSPQISDESKLLTTLYQNSECNIVDLTLD